METEKWAWSILVWRRTPQPGGGVNQENRHCLGFVMATSKYEAEGKAAACGRRIYRPEDGWNGHDVVVCQTSAATLDPEQTTHCVK